MDDRSSTHIAFALAAALGLLFAAGAQATGITTASGSGATSGPNSTVTLAPGQSKVMGKTADTFTPFAGSRANAVNLATGLRSGSEITLTGPGPTGQITTTTFTPPTKPMGYGNIDKALALSSQQLASAGVAQPTPQQIQTSLMGGTIINDAGQHIQMQGVLQMRADGMGWGQIAHQLGVKPGQGYRTAYTASGVTTAASTPGVVSAKSKQGVTTTAGAGKPSSAASQGSRSGIVTATGASAGHGTAHASHQGTKHRADVVTTAGGKSSGVTHGTGGRSAGVVSTAGGSMSSGSGGGLAKGHSK